MKKWYKLIVSSMVLLSLAACGKGNSENGTNGESDTLVIYSPNSEGLINATVPAFEEKYGVKVELIQAGTGELFKKLESEKNAPVADIILVVRIHNMPNMASYLKNMFRQKMRMLLKNIVILPDILHPIP